MLSTLSILSLDQGKLRRRPTSDEGYFASFRAAPPPEEEREHWYNLGIEWPFFGRRANREGL